MPDFYKLVKGSTQYKDNDFSADSSSIYWSGFNEKNPVSSYDIYWNRIQDVYENATLWGKQGIRPDDVRQGLLGNCWFLASASAIAEKPSRMEQVFLNLDTELNDAGIYGVNLIGLGVPYTVIVDDRIPTIKRQEKGKTVYRSPFAKLAKDGSIWMTILEKAFAKTHGNYLHIEGGDTRMGIDQIYGAPWENF